MIEKSLGLKTAKNRSISNNRSLNSQHNKTSRILLVGVKTASALNMKKSTPVINTVEGGNTEI